ncbi:MAG: queuosine precursor transporter [Lachnospiraceae bacterium]|nr:queuosine precursor transporter [Lachnospiraceae bacterium]
MNNPERKFTGNYVLLGMIFVSCLLVSNIIAGKIWSPGWNITFPASVILFPITYIISGILTGVYGFSNTKHIIWCGFTCNFVAVIAYVITVDLPHPNFWLDQEAYAVVLGMAPRVLLASFIAYLFGEFSKTIVLSKMKVNAKGERLWLRMIGSSIVGEALDSLIFSTIAFAGTISAKQLLTMILFQYLFKLCFETVTTPATCKIINKLKKIENIDTFDYEERYRIL